MTDFVQHIDRLETKPLFQAVPYQVSIIIVRTEQEMQLYEGVPYEHGMDEAAIYVVFIYARHLVTVWIVGELEPQERKRVSQDILNYMKYRTRLM